MPTLACVPRAGSSRLTASYRVRVLRASAYSSTAEMLGWGFRPPQRYVSPESPERTRTGFLANTAERIRGELMKLGIRVAKTTIQKYASLARPHPAHGQNWSTFLRNHARLVWACDFLPVIDLFFRQTYPFFIIELGSRQIVHFGVTSHPTDAWVRQQRREATPYGLTPRFLIRDRDSKCGDGFTRVAKASSIEVPKTPYRAPKANAVSERFLGSLRQECLDHLLVVGDRNLHRVIKQYVEYFNQARPHQGIGQRIPGRTLPLPAWPRREGLITVPVLNGLHDNHRRAV